MLYFFGGALGRWMGFQTSDGGYITQVGRQLIATLNWVSLKNCIPKSQGLIIIPFQQLAMFSR